MRVQQDKGKDMRLNMMSATYIRPIFEVAAGDKVNIFS